MSSLEDYFFVKNTRYLLWGAGALIVGLLIFHAGVVVGVRNHEVGEGEHPPFRAFGVPLPHGFIQDGHGAVGTIETYVPPILTIETREGAAESVVVATTTQLEPPIGSGGSTSTELTPGARVIIIGVPSQGGIEAKLIRVLQP